MILNMWITIFKGFYLFFQARGTARENCLHCSSEVMLGLAAGENFDQRRPYNGVYSLFRVNIIICKYVCLVILVLRIRKKYATLWLPIRVEKCQPKQRIQKHF